MSLPEEWDHFKRKSGRSDCGSVFKLKQTPIFAHPYLSLRCSGVCLCHFCRTSVIQLSNSFYTFIYLFKSNNQTKLQKITTNLKQWAVFKASDNCVTVQKIQMFVSVYQQFALCGKRPWSSCLGFLFVTTRNRIHTG